MSQEAKPTKECIKNFAKRYEDIINTGKEALEIATAIPANFKQFLMLEARLAFAHTPRNTAIVLQAFKDKELPKLLLTFDEWKEKGIKIRKGAKAVNLYLKRPVNFYYLGNDSNNIPIYKHSSKASELTKDQLKAAELITRHLSRSVPVFDISQTVINPAKYHYFDINSYIIPNNGELALAGNQKVLAFLLKDDSINIPQYTIEMFLEHLEAYVHECISFYQTQNTNPDLSIDAKTSNLIAPILFYQFAALFDTKAKQPNLADFLEINNLEQILRIKNQIGKLIHRNIIYAVKQFTNHKMAAKDEELAKETNNLNQEVELEVENTGD